MIICGDVMDAVKESAGAKLVIADPPWTYTNTGTARRGFNGCAHGVYETDGIAQIAKVLDAAYEPSADDAYLLIWSTWPLLGEWFPAMSALKWRYLTGGSWHKTGGLGVGFHVRGDSEPWFLLAKGKPKPTGTLSNAWSSRRTQHSEKPVHWLRKAIETLTDPGDLVLSLWSGMCPEARAAQMFGRRLVGAELDPVRHRTAVAMLAQREMF